LSDLLEKPKLESVTKELNECILEYNNQNKNKNIQIDKEVIIVSAVQLSGFQNLQKCIQYSKISTKKKELPLSVYASLTTIKQQSNQLIWRENIVEPYKLEFFDRIGEIIYFPKSGWFFLK